MKQKVFIVNGTIIEIQEKKTLRTLVLSLFTHVGNTLFMLFIAQNL